MEKLTVTSEQAKKVGALLAGAMLVVLTQTAISPALPVIMAELNVDQTTVQWLTSAYAATEAVIIPLAAWCMGRFNTRVLYAACMVLFCVGSLCGVFAPTFAFVLLGRVLQAVSAGIMMVVVMSLMLLSFPHEHRGKVMGVVSLVIGFAPAVGPFCGGIIVDTLGWRFLFVIVAVLAILIALAGIVFLGDTQKFPATRFDLLSVVCSSIGLVSLLYGLSTFATNPNVWVSVGLMLLGLVFVALFAWRQFSLSQPLLRLDAFKSTSYRIAIVAVVFLQAILIGLVVLMPIYVQDVLGFSATVSGLVILPGAGIGALAAVWAGRIFDRHGIRMLALGGSLLLAVAGVGMFFYGAQSPLWFVILANMANGISIQLLVTPLITWGINSLPDDLVQHATAVTNTMNQIGGAFGTAVIMSFSAFGISVSPASSPVQRLYEGCHFSYAVVLVFSVVVLFIVAFFVRQPRVAGVSSVLTAASVKDSLHSAGYSVRDVMSTDILSIPASASLSDAVRLMAESGASGGVLVGEAGELEGFVSNSDVLRFFGDEASVVVGGDGFAALTMLGDNRLQERIQLMRTEQAREVATKRLVCISPDAPFAEACRLLAERRLKVLPVVEGSKLVGVLHRHDLLGFIADALASETDALASEADAS